MIFPVSFTSQAIRFLGNFWGTVKPSSDAQPTEVMGAKPSGRNGHSATLLGESILILGGWLGNGPLAAGESWARKKMVEFMGDPQVTMAFNIYGPRIG